jgi:hypothetical protein
LIEISAEQLSMSIVGKITPKSGSFDWNCVVNYQISGILKQMIHGESILRFEAHKIETLARFSLTDSNL